jgi:hypothetical protein
MHTKSVLFYTSCPTFGMSLFIIVLAYTYCLGNKILRTLQKLEATVRRIVEHSRNQALAFNC